MRFLRCSLAALVIVLLAPPASAQEATTGGIAGRVFFEKDGRGGGGEVWVQAFKMPGLVRSRGTCVDGFRYEISGLEPGTYKIRLGFGCGEGGDRGPHEWFVQTSGHRCAARVIVAAGFTTDGINADVDPERGPEYRCGSGGPSASPAGGAGVQRPIAQPTATPMPTGEVSFEPGVIADPPPATPVGVVIGFAALLVLAVAGFLLWLVRRGGGAGPSAGAPADSVSSGAIPD